MTMPREATIEDLPVLLALGEAMHAESPRYRRLSFDADRLEATLRQLIGQVNGFVRIAGDGGAVDGVMVAMVSPHWTSWDLVATDLALYVMPDARGGHVGARLVRAYLEWARERGATLVQAGVTAGIADAGRLYAACGATRCGEVWEW